MDNHSKYYSILIFTCGVAVSLSAAYYSVFGLGKLFGGAKTQVMIMASTLEISKLVVAATLQRYWNTISILLKTYLLVAIVILIGITSLGIYGYLSSAYEYTKASDMASTETIQIRQTELDLLLKDTERRQFERNKLSEQVNTLRTSLSSNTQQSVDRKTGQLIITTSNSNRKAYEDQIQHAMKAIDGIDVYLTSSRNNIITAQTNISELKMNANKKSELGPLKYIATITGINIDNIVNYIILILILVFDPLAVILLILSQHVRTDKRIKTIENTKNNLNVTPLFTSTLATPEKKFHENLNNLTTNDVNSPEGSIKGKNIPLDYINYIDNSPKEIDDNPIKIDNSPKEKDTEISVREDNSTIDNRIIVRQDNSTIDTVDDNTIVHKDNSILEPQDNSTIVHQNNVIEGNDLPKTLADKLKTFLSKDNTITNPPISAQQRRIFTDNQVRELERKLLENE